MNPDVVIVGAGADGPAMAWKLGRQGVDVLVLEAGAWHGNEQWENPHEEPGAAQSSDPDDLNGTLLDEQFHGREIDSNNPATGKLRVGPANRDRAPWFRSIPQNGFVWQVSGVGGTSLHYFANHPRAYPSAIDDQPHWPIDYEELVPYYQVAEEMTSVHPAPTTPKEAIYYEGAEAAGYDLVDQLNVTETGYRPQPNAITPPSEKLAADGDYDGDFTYPDVEGDTLVCDGLQGAPTPLEAPLEEKSRKSSNVSFVPPALRTGNVTIRPNTFVTNVNTETHLGDPVATGVDYRDTWSGETGTIDADVVVLAAGCIETPRLWLNADLPDNGWVGKGMTSHWFDYIVGLFDEETIEEITGRDDLMPYVGHNSAARFDKPGVGGLELAGLTPGLTSFSNFGFSQGGYNFDGEVDPDAPWDTRGRIVGREFKRMMADYDQMMSIITLTDDLPRQSNGVSLDPVFSDEHGPVPLIEWEPHPDDDAKRDELSEIAADILQSAGADHVHRCDWPPILLHMQSSMAMGKVLDENAEAYDVSRLFVGDHSALANGVGGPNPTNSGQALALRTADRIVDLYF